MKKIYPILFFLLLITGAVYAQDEVEVDNSDTGEILPTEPLFNDDSTATEPIPTESSTESTSSNTEDATEDDFTIPEDNEEPAVPSEAGLATHQMTFEFIAHVTFTRDDEISPHMEIQYTNRIEVGIDLGPRRTSNNATLNYEVQNWGYLSQTEQLTCGLEVTPTEVPVEVKGQTKTDVNSETGQTTYLRIDLTEPILEDWFATCSDGSTILRSRGDAEKYNMKVLQAMEPQMSSYVFENFNPAEKSRIEISTTPTPIEDTELSQTLLIWGEGSITLEPL